MKKRLFFLLPLFMLAFCFTMTAQSTPTVVVTDYNTALKAYEFEVSHHNLNSTNDINTGLLKYQTVFSFIDSASYDPATNKVTLLCDNAMAFSDVLPYVKDFNKNIVNTSHFNPQ